MTYLPHVIYVLKTTYSPHYYETNELQSRSYSGIRWLKDPRILLVYYPENKIVKNLDPFWLNRFIEPIIKEYRKKYINDFV